MPKGTTFFKMRYILAFNFRSGFEMRISAIIIIFIISLFIVVGAGISFLPHNESHSQEEYQCLRARCKIEVDGNLAEWSALSPIQLQWNWQVQGEGWGGPEDLSALCWLTWDEKRLYFAFDIWDDYPQPLLPNQKAWQGEGVFLSLRFPDIERAPDIRGSSVNSLFLVFNLTEQEGKGVKIVESGRGFYLRKLEGLNLVARKKKSGEGTLYEGSIPWYSLLPPECARPSNIEVNIIINDIDKEPSTRKSIQWVLTPDDQPYKQSYAAVKLLTMSSKPAASRVPDTPTTYHRDVPLVLLNVTVMNSYNEYILGLKKDDFLVYENGQLQEIVHFDRTERPITMAVLLDTSGSMQGKIETAQKAAIRFVESSLKLQDQALIMEFNTKPSVLLDFTNDIEIISEAIKKTTAWGGTALYDALYQTLERLQYLKETKAIILLSDGRDESYIGSGPGSKRTLGSVLSLVRKTDAIVYSIGLGYSDTKAQYVLHRLSDFSGGRCYFPREVSDLHSVYSQVGEDLRSRYLIGYYPKDLRFDGRWRTVRVALKKKGFVAKTRKGYYATKK